MIDKLFIHETIHETLNYLTGAGMQDYWHEKT